MKLRFFLISGICIGIAVKLFVIDIVKVAGTSMEPAIKDNSIICINKLAYGIPKPLGSSLLFQWKEPALGDIIVYMYKGKPVIKRCAACAGEVLEFSSDSEYSLSVGEKTYPLTEKQYQRIKFDTVVPEKTVLALGDNSFYSVDSRDYGFIPTENVLGKVIGR
ncbi:signal peptidase I [Treponema sp. OMZ 840]|uniref:signal peptidase I n=1 Tax=Treponema sp. OMZ 840 TaxID=244313 RepID=UPI003D91E1DB